MRTREWIWAPALIAASIIGPGVNAPEARADGILTSVEAAYVEAAGPTAICPVLDMYPTTSGVLGVVDGIGADGFTLDNAVDIINAAVWEYCPRHWPLLVSIGQAAAAGSNPTVPAGHRMGEAI